MCRDNTHNVEHSTYLERGAGVIGTITGSSRANCKFALYDSALEVNCKHAGGNCLHTKFQKCWLYHHDDMTRAAGPSTSKYSWYAHSWFYRMHRPHTHFLQLPEVSAVSMQRGARVCLGSPPQMLLHV